MDVRLVALWVPGGVLGVSLCWPGLTVGGAIAPVPNTPPHSLTEWVSHIHSCSSELAHIDVCHLKKKNPCERLELVHVVTPCRGAIKGQWGVIEA